MSYPLSQTDKGKIIRLNVQKATAFIANRYYSEKLYSTQATLSKLLAHLHNYRLYDDKNHSE